MNLQGHRYILVFALRLPDGAPLLTAARGLATKTSVEVVAG